MGWKEKETVTPKLNYDNSGTCSNGHSWQEWARINSKGYRYCCLCSREGGKKWMQKTFDKSPPDQRTPVLLSTTEEWAYLAGILDGEGTIGVYLRSRNHSGSRQKISSVSYRPRMSAPNTNKDLIDWLHKNLGGRVSLRVKQENCKPCWQWNLVAVESIFEILENILPFLIVKKKQAELVLTWPINAKHNQWMPEEGKRIAELKQSLYEETLRLNKRGDTNSLDSITSRKT